MCSSLYLHYALSKPHFTRKAILWKNAETFLENAIQESNENIFKVQVPMRKIDEQVLHCDINDPLSLNQQYCTKSSTKYRNGYHGKQIPRKKHLFHYGSPSKVLQKQETKSLSISLLVTFGECVATMTSRCIIFT
jgi:hypothetical protein